MASFSCILSVLQYWTNCSSVLFRLVAQILHNLLAQHDEQNLFFRSVKDLFNSTHLF